tara:strand:- start:5 stop:337 length:333 start_codon:yes stop_codon:yes gene_type:complete
MNQISLFDQTAPHNRTETSIEAAIEIQEHIGPLQELVLNAINKSSNGMTRDELSVELEIPTATICGRCNELVKMGKISPMFKLNKKIKRATKSGRSAEVLFSCVNTPKQA